MNSPQQPSEAQRAGASPAGTAEEAPSATMRRIALASGIGTTIEYFDFVIYAAVAALVFPSVFFPALGAAAGTVAAFATLGVAFVARPLGSLIFGHFGDRLGRKRTLLATLFLMGIATILVGLMPTAEQIGVTAPILVVLLRVMQGIAVGGEWTGATLMAAEHAPKRQRGFWSMFAGLGGAAGAALALFVLLVTGLTMSPEAFMSYGWRIPFLASVIMLAVGLYIRLKIDETPAFTAEAARGTVAKVPIVEAVKRQPREVIFASGVLVTVFAFFYLVAGYLISYGTATLQLDKNVVLGVAILACVVFGLAMVVSSALSDRIGRRVVIVAANAVAVVWALLLFPILDSATVTTFALGACVTTLIGGAAYGPLCAVISELFHTRYRYSASGFTYNVSGVIGGGIPPVVAAAITGTYGSFAFGVFLAGLCLLSLLCTLALGETRDYDMDRADPALAD